MKRTALLMAVGVSVLLALVVGAALATPPKQATTTPIAKQPSNAAVQGRMPYTFFLTRYEMHPNPTNPSWVRYHNNGKPFAKAPDGSKVILSGKGGRNPKKETANGGGPRTPKEAPGAVAGEQTW